MVKVLTPIRVYKVIIPGSYYGIISVLVIAPSRVVYEVISVDRHPYMWLVIKYVILVQPKHTPSLDVSFKGFIKPRVPYPIPVFIPCIIL